MPMLTLGRYILELALMEYDLNVETSESKLAAAALVLVMIIKGVDQVRWRHILEFYSGHKVCKLQLIKYGKILHCLLK